MKRLCKSCSKRRDLKFYNPSGSFICDMCKISKKHGKKLERREASIRTWIKRCDALVGSQVRSRGVCEDIRIHNCTKVWQWAHGLSRSYHNTRHMEDNGFCLCSGAHKFYTDRPLEWEVFLLQKWGEEKLRYMKKIALDHGKVIDYKELYENMVLDLQHEGKI